MKFSKNKKNYYLRFDLLYTMDNKELNKEIIQ